MTRLWLVPLTLALLSATSLTADDKKNNEPFQGKWKIAAIEVDGEKIEKDKFDQAVLTVTGDERVLKEGDKVVSRSKYKVDPTKNPKTIDIMVSEGAFKDKTLRGIYEFKGDTHTINVTIEGEERPTDFTTKPNSGRLLQTFKRVSDK